LSSPIGTVSNLPWRFFYGVFAISTSAFIVLLPDREVICTSVPNVLFRTRLVGFVTAVPQWMSLAIAIRHQHSSVRRPNDPGRHHVGMESIGEAGLPGQSHRLYTHYRLKRRRCFILACFSGCPVRLREQHGMDPG